MDKNLSFIFLTHKFLAFSCHCVVSPILCSALFDIYLGAHPIDAKAKSQIASTIHKSLNSSHKEDRDTIDKTEEEAVQKADKKSRLPRKLAVLKSKL